MNTIERVQELRQKASDELKELRQKLNEVQRQHQRKKAEIIEYEATLKVLKSLESEPQDVVQHPTYSGVVGDELQSLDKNVTAKAAIASIILDHPRDGLKAAKLHQMAQKRFGLTINPKTVSNVLWKLKEEGIAYSEGHRWFAKQNSSPSEKGELL